MTDNCGSNEKNCIKSKIQASGIYAEVWHFYETKFDVSIKNA